MNSLSVLENINIQKKNIENLIQQKNEIEKEILRLEGTLRVFTELKGLGVEIIQIKKEPDIVIDNTEVIDDIPHGDQPNEE